MPGAVDRVAGARSRCVGKLAALYAAAGVSFPAARIFLRAFKHERQLELWAGEVSGTAVSFRWVTIYPILGASGVLGPKRCEGDRQVPEGVYRVTGFNPQSRFHLSLRLDYPNAADLALTTNPQAPGSDIYLHGGTHSTGCLAMGNDAIEEIYLATRDAQHTTVHLFPCRMDETNWQGLLVPLISGQPALETHWRTLRKIYDAFEQGRYLAVG